jgi:hypothetical protein
MVAARSALRHLARVADDCASSVPMTTEPLRLRIVLVDPPAGVRWAMQHGRDELVPPVRATKGEVVLETTVTLSPSRVDGALVPRGAAIQGPAAARFIYANSGTYAGDAGTPWSRRAKIPLKGLTPALLEAWQRTPGATLEARIAGTARDGGPACATVPLLGDGWRVVKS